MKKLRLFFYGWVIGGFCLILFSCNNSGVTPTNYARFQVVNALAGSTPFNFYLNSTIKSSTSITFPASSGYVSTTPGSYFFQVSLATTPSTYIYSSTNNLVFGVDSSYTAFITGQSTTPIAIVTRDTLTLPANGKAKIRFVNTSYNSPGLDITLNAVTGYKNVMYKGLGGFIQVPAGIYEFKAYSTGTTSNLATLSNQPLADGKIYTLYANGLIGSTAINAVFGLNLITNLLPATK